MCCNTSLTSQASGKFSRSWLTNKLSSSREGTRGDRLHRATAEMEDPPGTSGLKEEQLMDLGPQGGPAISSWPEGSAVVVVGRPGQLGTKGPHASTKRSKKGKLKASKGLAPPPLGPADFVRVVPVPKRSEVRSVLGKGDSLAL